ncbi:MAG TPA: DinB family protein [Flavilitoribacter sp.]|nr:DinB family protein [Flavilitoribacter sp.]
MHFDIQHAIEILERTPAVIESLLSGISREWYAADEGENTWSPYDIVGHLIHGEKTDWIERAEIILSGQPDKTFRPFDRFAQFDNSKGKTLEQLIGEFKDLRRKNLAHLKKLAVTPGSLDRIGIHPAFGEVTLRQLLATWTVHDLGHIGQIARVMAKQYKAEVGPWIEYLPILTLK